MIKTTKKYNDADLAEFKALIEGKLAKAEEQLNISSAQLAETVEDKDDAGEFMDESSSSNDVEILQALVERQETNVAELKNALQRIANKTYGICIVSGELIDKRRLLAIPTTVKALKPKN